MFVQQNVKLEILMETKHINDIAIFYKAFIKR